MDIEKRANYEDKRDSNYQATPEFREDFNLVTCLVYTYKQTTSDCLLMKEVSSRDEW